METIVNDPIAVATFALSTLGALVRVSIQAGRILRRMDELGERVARLERERRAPMPPKVIIPAE